MTRTAWERLTARYLNNPHPADPVPASQAAMLTTRQLAMLQGFPDGWQWKGATRQDIHQMIANAVPSPLAEAIGRVILARENGQSIPDVEGRFMNWLMETGRSSQSARNVKSQVNRARRLLGGRTFSDTGLELARLELNAEFKTLTVRTRSDLRAALRLYAEYLDRKGKVAHSRIAKISRMAA